MFRRINYYYLINFIAIIFLLFLPYYLFDGKLFIGGDDTRLFYSYPLEFLKHISFFAWHNVSTIGISSQDQFLLPFLTIWSFLSIFITSKIVLSYLAFSLAIILGLIFFQICVKELFSLKKEQEFELFTGSIFYILSPILIQNQYFIYLTTIWLIGLIPLVLYLFLRYIKSSDFIFVLIAAIVCVIFSISLYSIPWILGFLLPIFIGLFCISFFYTKREKINFFKKFIVFFVFIGLTQSYWLLSFLLSYIVVDSNSFAQKFVSEGFVDTFSPTVLATATGNIFYPLFGLFHREIAFDFVWLLSNIYTNFYDKYLFFGVVYILALFLGIFFHKKNLSESQKKTYLFLLISFLFSLFFFTVNIGPFKNLFLSFGSIPGFLMFRNFYDKFALGYILIYSILMVISLVILKKQKFYKYLLTVFIIVTIIFSFPIKQTVNAPMWTTKNVYRVIKIPNEYLDFMNEIKLKILPTSFILNLPFGNSIYSVIKDENSNNVYVGTSPVVVFSGISDISGHYSFNFSEEAYTIDDYFLKKDFAKLNEILHKYNINYVMVTKNIPEEVKKAWVFNEKILEVQDQDFISQITSRKIFESSEGNYELYETKKRNSIIDSKNVTYKKISPVKYKINLEKVKGNQELIFNDSYHEGWRLFLIDNSSKNWCESKIQIKKTIYECAIDDKLFEINDLKYIFNKDIYGGAHTSVNNFSNNWDVDTTFIKNNFSKEYYNENSDGSIDIEMELYFVPQSYIYYGVLISVSTFMLSFLYYIYVKKNKKNH